MSGVHDFISKIDRLDTDITKKYDKFDENIDLNNRLGDPLESDIKRTTTKKPPTTNLAYGKNKVKKEGTTADEKDRIINLSKENRLLKEKENLLEKEILKLNTKLRRIDNLARSVSHMQANDPSNQHGNVDMFSLQTELQDQLSSLRDENQRKKKKNYQLKEIEKDLKFKAKNSHLPTTSHNSKYDHVQGKLGFTRMSKGN
jgi:predicted RNase H-like nuclease (RuvC/YqgF family)